MKAQSGRRGLEAADQLQLVGRGECFGLQLCTVTTGFDASLTLTIAMPMTTTPAKRTSTAARARKRR